MFWNHRNTPESVFPGWGAARRASWKSPSGPLPIGLERDRGYVMALIDTHVIMDTSNTMSLVLVLNYAVANGQYR